MRPNHQPRLPYQVRLHFMLLSLLVATLLPAKALPAQETTRDTTHASDSTHSPGWVVISVPDYRALRLRAFPAEREPEPPPIDATLSRLDYDLRLDGEIVSGHVTLTVDVLKNGWVRIPIPKDLFVRGATLDGKPLSLAAHTVNNDPSQLYALLSHPGRATITLDIALPVTTSSARDERLVLPPTSSGVTSVSFVIPHAGVDLFLWGGIFAETKDLPNGNKWLVYGLDSSPITFAWKHKAEEAQQHNALPLRMHGALTQFVGLGEDSTSLTANVTLDVTQGAAKEARVRLPDNVTINQVQGALVADWQMTPGELLITFLEPVEQSASFIITGETTLPREGPIDVPLLRLTGVERETGGLGVDVLGAGEIKEETIKSQGFLRADPSDLGDPVAKRQSPALIAFRTHSVDAAAPRALHIVVTRYTQQAVLLANVSEARYRVLLTKDGKSLVEARYAVRNNQRTFVKITLPPGAALWSASLAGNPIRPGSGPDSSLLVPLSKAKSGEDAPEFSVVVVYFAPGTNWTDKGHLKVALPALDLPISRTGLQVFYPPQFRFAAEPSSFHVETYANPISTVLTAEAAEPAVDSVIPTAGSTGGAGVVMAVLTPPRVLESQAGAPSADRKDEASKQSAQTLVDKFHASERGSRASGILPVRVNFPAFGSSLYLVSELTSENQAPSAEFSYQQDKKAGGK
jgi:hypothetical protein